MRLPKIRGVIDRRILANYRVDPKCMESVLPAPFRPKLVNGFAIGGICLIRLKSIRPKLLPLPWGLSSENAAHRIAVEWENNGQFHNGVYVPRRDTNSRLNVISGGLLFPGIQHLASFSVIEKDDSYSVTMNSNDKTTSVHVSGNIGNGFDDKSAFKSLQSASEFFQNGSLGYSDTKIRGKYDGMELKCETSDVLPLNVSSIKSTYFDDVQRFPSGSVEFDCALLMRNIKHEWHGQSDLCCRVTA